MELIIGLILTLVALGGVGLFALWAQDTIPQKINESAAKDEIKKFDNSPVTVYAVSKIIEGMNCNIQRASRQNTYQYVECDYTITVSSHEIHGEDWYYNFHNNRYPDLNSDVDRTALAMAITNSALPKLRSTFVKDLCGSTDVKFTYSKDYHRGINYSFEDTHGYTSITFYYKATNLHYEELKSW